MKTAMLIIAIIVFAGSVFWFFTQTKTTSTQSTPVFQTETPGINTQDDRQTEILTPREPTSFESNTSSTITSPLVCTMDVQQCADGSYVGRVPPSCAFAQCPVKLPAISK